MTFDCGEEGLPSIHPRGGTGVLRLLKTHMSIVSTIIPHVRRLTMLRRTMETLIKRGTGFDPGNQGDTKLFRQSTLAPPRRTRMKRRHSVKPRGIEGSRSPVHFNV